MPIISTKVETPVDVEFEVYCTCGEGMCNRTDVRDSRSRKMPQIIVDACPECLEKAKAQGAHELEEAMQDKIDVLEAEVERLRDLLHRESN
jgi:hypothetical protein